MGPIRRFIVEYVGNLHPTSGPDRRSNRHVRELMDWIHGQMEARGFPEAKQHALVAELRRVLGPAGPAGGDAQGVSRDAPS